MTNSHSDDCSSLGSADRWHIELGGSRNEQPGHGRVVGFCAVPSDVESTPGQQAHGEAYGEGHEEGHGQEQEEGQRREREKLLSPEQSTPPEDGWSFIASSETNDTIAAAYTQAMNAGLYTRWSEVVVSGAGDGGGKLPRGSAVSHYAATNHSEYFAECSEAFFSSRRFRNDYYPYVHPELQGFDESGYRMCETVWGVSGATLPTRLCFPDLWQQRLKGGGARRKAALAR